MVPSPKGRTESMAGGLDKWDNQGGGWADGNRGGEGGFDGCKLLSSQLWCRNRELLRLSERTGHLKGEFVVLCAYSGVVKGVDGKGGGSRGERASGWD